MDVLKSMSVFKRVAETGNFSEVAREMEISQPSITKHIAALESHLQVKLLNRSTRQLSLTNIGKQYYDLCLPILNQLTEIESTLREQHSQPSGSLRINTPITFGELEIAPHLWEFLKDNPSLNIDLHMDDHYVDLVKEGVDLAIRVGPLSDSNLIARKIGDSPRVTVATPAYLEQHGEPDTIQALSAHNCLVYMLLTTRNLWCFNGPNGEETIQVQGQFKVNNPRIIRQAVLAHQGIAVTPLWLIQDDIKDGRVKTILNNYTPTSLEIHALYPDRQFVPTKVTHFIEYIQQKLNTK